MPIKNCQYTLTKLELSKNPFLYLPPHLSYRGGNARSVWRRQHALSCGKDFYTCCTPLPGLPQMRPERKLGSEKKTIRIMSWGLRIFKWGNKRPQSSKCLFLVVIALEQIRSFQSYLKKEKEKNHWKNNRKAFGLGIVCRISQSLYSI